MKMLQPFINELLIESLLVITSGGIPLWIVKHEDVRPYDSGSGDVVCTGAGWKWGYCFGSFRVDVYHGFYQDVSFKGYRQITDEFCVVNSIMLTLYIGDIPIHFPHFKSLPNFHNDIIF
jgi:hypothetical protein